MDREEKSIKLGLTNYQKNMDKVYYVNLCESERGWEVKARYGKRDAYYYPEIDKTPGPVTYGKAEEIYHELIRSKLRKGYEEE
jgi:predicted DNA-binding WGR domain protein